MNATRDEQCGQNDRLSRKLGPSRHAHDVMHEEGRMAGKSLPHEFVPEHSRKEAIEDLSHTPMLAQRPTWTQRTQKISARCTLLEYLQREASSSVARRRKRLQARS